MNLFFRNKSNKRVNPATDDTLAKIAAQTDLLSFGTGSNPANLEVNIEAINSSADIGIQNASNITINPATQETLAAIESQINKFTFDGKQGLQTNGTAPTLASIVSVKDTTSTQVNPSSDDSLAYLRRMVKLMESKLTVDSNKMKRINIDAFGNVVTGTGASGAGVPLVTIANDFSENLTGLYTSSTYLGWNDQMYTDPARNAYARSIRNNLHFS